MIIFFINSSTKNVAVIVHQSYNNLCHFRSSLFLNTYYRDPFFVISMLEMFQCLPSFNLFICFSFAYVKNLRKITNYSKN